MISRINTSSSVPSFSHNHGVCRLRHSLCCSMPLMTSYMSLPDVFFLRLAIMASMSSSSPPSLRLSLFLCEGGDGDLRCPRPPPLDSP